MEIGTRKARGRGRGAGGRGKGDGGSRGGRERAEDAGVVQKECGGCGRSARGVPEGAGRVQECGEACRGKGAGWGGRAQKGREKAVRGG